MLVPVHHLKTLVPTKLSPEALGERFLMTSSELEKVHSLATEKASTFDFVVVGHVQTVDKHPNADRLRVCTVDIGQKESVQIVCGAPNVRAGMYAPVALPGATVQWHGGETVVIKAAALRGVDSFGMLCAAEELGLAVQHEDGLWELEKAKAGTPLLQATGLDDVVLDLEITPNRPDLLSLEGLAREVHAFDHRPFKPYAAKQIKPAAEGVLEVSIEAGAHCHRLTAIALRITSLPTYSPWWLQRTLILSGIKPIHPVVDVTNYVMIELGQPLHAYDAAKLSTPSLTAKSVKGEGEFIGLDDTVRTLAAGDLIIANKRTPVALAGIMGGASSAITASTTDVILEAAAFDGGSIRRTSRRLGLRTEASGRFEKGVDAEGTLRALSRAVELLSDMGEIIVTSKVADTGSLKQSAPKIAFIPEEFESVIGARVSVPEARRILESLGFTIVSASKSRLVCTPPSWRSDVSRTEDVYEEIVRIWGFERIPATLPKGSISAPMPNAAFTLKMQVLKRLASLGFQTLVSQSFVGDRELEISGLQPADSLPLANPLSKLESRLAHSHLPLHLRLISKNQTQEVSRYAEISSTFHATAPLERETLSVTVRGAKNSEEDLLRDVKRALLTVAEGIVFVKESASELLILKGERVVGRVFAVPPRVLQSWKIRRNPFVIFAALELEALQASGKKVFVPLPQYPQSTRDTTFALKDLVYSQLHEVLEQITHDTLRASTLTATFKKDSLQTVTLRFTYGSSEGTLTDAEVDAAHTSILSAIQAKLPTITII